MIRFVTNIDCAQKLLRRMNEDKEWTWRRGTMPNKAPVVGDWVEVFNERRGDDYRTAKMIVASRTWKDGVLEVYLDADPMWYRKADLINDSADIRAHADYDVPPVGRHHPRVDGLTLFERWINWQPLQA